MVLPTILLAAFTVAVKVSIISLLLLLARGIFWLVNMLLVAPLFDPLQNLPGPEGAALQNHFKEVMEYVLICCSLNAVHELTCHSYPGSPNVSAETHETWKKKFGNTFRFHGFGKVQLVFIYFLEHSSSGQTA
jgi:hypothetical protein